MDILDQFEFPLPVLKTESEKIVIEASGNAWGRFSVSNAGGGTLEGRVMSNSPAFRFLSDNFTGNSVRLEYETDVTGCKAGDLIRSSAVIMSNGGEKSIPVIIKVKAQTIEATDSQQISSLKDFLACAHKNPDNAGRMFSSKAFRTWLADTGYEYMDIFDFIAQDSNKPRAMESFFILNKQKNRPVLSIPQSIFSHEFEPVNAKKISGTFQIKKNGWGYIECPLSVADSIRWLTVKPNLLTSGMFNENDEAEVEYFIDPAQINSKAEKASVNIAEFGTVEFRVRKKPLFECFIGRDSYLYEDTGYLTVKNHSGADAMFEISASDGYIKLDGRKYLIGASAEIPFKIKLTGIQVAQLAIRRQPYVPGEITVKAGYDKTRFKKVIKLMIGNP